jgi:uncharacterized protein
MRASGFRAFDEPLRIEAQPVPAPSRGQVPVTSELASAALPHRSAQLEELSQGECLLRLEANGVGRVAGVLDSRPYICPVNYVVHEGAIIFRTRIGSHLHKATLDSYAAFEIDSADFMYHEGWTVLVQGRSSHVVDPADVITLARVCAAPWVDDARDSFVRIRLDQVRGERISHRPVDATPRQTPETIPSSSEGGGQGGP